MLAKLKYEVTFPSTGRHLSGDFSFQKGFGAITGPNEAGKSVILEMIRFSLFGTAALRGDLVDYKNLKVELEFAIRGETYRTKRTSNTAKIFRGDTEIANGVKGVNNKVVELLGFGLQVFDTACVANQGDIEKLGSMKPTERKAMVDSVIGLSVIDEIAKWCAGEASTLASAIGGMEDGLVKPQEPAKPEGYEPSADMEPELFRLRELRDELHRVKGRLSLARKDKPNKPVAPTDTAAEELEELVEKARRYEDAQRQLKALPAPPEVDPDEINVDDWELRERLKRDLPVMTAEVIAKADADLELVRKFEKLDHLVKQWHDLVAVGQHTCPECTHSWPMEKARIDAVKSQVDSLTAELEGKERPSKPDMGNIDVARRQLQAFEKVRDEWERVKDTPKPLYTRQQLAQMQVAKAAQAKRPELEAVEPASADSKTLNALWRDRLAYDHALASYEQRLSEWQEQETNHAIDEKRAGELMSVPTMLNVLEQKYQEARIYEDRLSTYTSQLGIYETRLEEIEKRKLEEEGYRKGKEALTILRRLVKQHLIPSLNKVASHYLSKMTGGKRNVIEVDDEFNIVVDNQPINTLSGSGKAVANLALRLGLGQVLTNNQFSVFLGDEIDASMDDDRAHNTALTLEYLANRISQILLVSHKYPQADYYIELEENEKSIDRQSD
ncbi:AAA family ATPase [Mesorhizobium sp. WSM2239]|uniref:AAA family ATPase n=2 Tax=unclassified Mesorhizobium TaxID=325217 RepID=A0AAU8D0Z5_9HYPH